MLRTQCVNDNEILNPLWGEKTKRFMLQFIHALRVRLRDSHSSEHVYARRPFNGIPQLCIHLTTLNQSIEQEQHNHYYYYYLLLLGALLYLQPVSLDT